MFSSYGKYHKIPATGLLYTRSYRRYANFTSSSNNCKNYGFERSSFYKARYFIYDDEKGIILMPPQVGVTGRSRVDKEKELKYR